VLVHDERLRGGRAAAGVVVHDVARGEDAREAGVEVVVDA
jgi:hypothetical protein